MRFRDRFRDKWNAQTPEQKMLLAAFAAILILVEVPLMIVWATLL